MGLEQSQHIKMNAPGTLFGNGSLGSITNDPGESFYFTPNSVTDYLLEEGETLNYGLTFFATKEIIINGIISTNGNDGQDGSAGGNGGNGQQCHWFQGLAGGDGGDNAAGGDADACLHLWQRNAAGLNGGAGGDGSGGVKGVGSVQSAAVGGSEIPILNNATQFMDPSYLMAVLHNIRTGAGGGGGGGDAGGNIGGGGGGAAGCIFLCAPVIRLGATAELNAIGGNGGDGEADNSGGGGGANGGIIVLIYEHLIDNGASFDVSGGIGGLGHGTGDDGSDGQDGYIFKIPVKTTLA